MSSMIEVKNVRKLFINEEGEKNEVLKNVNFHVDKNEFVVIFGPGQCGKTTLLNIIAGLEEATDGEVLKMGETVSGPGGGFSGYPLIPMAYGNAKCGIQHESPRHGYQNAAGGGGEIYRSGGTERV